MATKKGPMEFTHWKRPVNRMYEYNHQFAENYYKPQVKYIECPTPNRRGTTEPPGAQSFIERWVAYPFYGRTEPISELRAKGFLRANSVPDLTLNPWEDAEVIAREEQNARLRSASRGRSVSRELSVFQEESENRARRADSEFNARNTRSRSRSYIGHVDNYIDEYGERELENILRVITDPAHRERSVSVLRDELDNPRVWKGKQKMKTTLRHGFYSNSLYGTLTWDPSPYITGRN